MGVVAPIRGGQNRIPHFNRLIFFPPMHIKDFAIERYFARYEFKTKYLLSSSDCDGFPMQYILDLATEPELAAWHNLRLGYTETRGSAPLRQAIAQHFEKIGPENIVVASPGEANFALMNVLLQPGDHVVCMAPMYQSLYEVAKSIGCELTFWKPDPVQRQWYFDPAHLEQLITPKTKLLIVNFPHNPTGYSPTPGDLEAIIDIARKHGITLFSDEMYRFLNHQPERVIGSVCDQYENAVSLWGTAKTFGLGGLRLGWLTSQNQAILDKVEAYKDYLSICNSAPSEVLGTIALRHLDQFVEPNLAKIRKNIALFETFSAEHAHLLDFIPPDSGSTAFIRLQLRDETAMQYAERLVQETGIMLLPSETFEYGTQHARIGFGRENLPEILEVWRVHLAAEG